MPLAATVPNRARPAPPSTGSGTSATKAPSTGKSPRKTRIPPLTAVLLNIVFNISGRKEDSEAPIFAESPAPAAISDEDEARLDPTGPVAQGVHQSGQARDAASPVSEGAVTPAGTSEGQR